MHVIRNDLKTARLGDDEPERGPWVDCKKKHISGETQQNRDGPRTYIVTPIVVYEISMAIAEA